MKVDLKPFPDRTSATIEQANRLLAFRDSPAHNVIHEICRQMVQEARDNQKNFKGWDTQQIVMLAIRVQVAEEFYEQLFVRINEAIMLGVNEARTSLQAVESSDRLRDQVLKKMDEEHRIPGSF